MRCPSCNNDNPGDAAFCEGCGAKLELICPACKASVSPAARFCKKCGTAISATKAAVSTTVSSPKSQVIVAPDGAASEAIEGERKTVTALFADIKGSTELMRDLDPEEARAIIDPALKLMIDAAHRYDGYVVQSTGDGIFALFGAPVAHEDHPQRALHAAIAIQQQLRAYAQADHRLKPAPLAEQRLKPVPLEVRIGINTGEVVLRMVHTGGHTEYTPVGHAANLAARMQAVAPAGGIVISEGTRRLVEGYFELRDLGPTEVKGISEPINVYEVVGAGALRGHFELAARRGLTKFVGREREVAELKRALELARGGHGQIVAAVAEAGTGKSRLYYEFKSTLPAECKVLEAYSVSHGKTSAWLPVLDLLYRYFGIEDADDKAARRGKIETRTNALDPALSDTLPLLYTLMGLHEGPDPLAQMDPQIKRRRTLDAIKRIILRGSLEQPTVVIFEDLHWIDSETQALLDLLADGIANARVLLLVNYRPEYRHEWGGKSYYIQLQLDALGRESAGEMLSTLLGDGVELNPLKRLIIERTEGNPFFIEEIAQALFDEGALIRNGEVKIIRPLSQLLLPPTVQGILASRIDRLSGEQKDLLQTLAVIGRESPLALIRQVASTADAPLEQMLSDLQAGEFIYEEPAPAGVAYVFKHALTQEVAYNSLLIERRKQLHERTGQAIESMFAEQLDDHLSQLAHHYSRSDKTDKAVEYLGRAGQQALRRSTFADAISNLTAAIEWLLLLPDSPQRARQELPLQLALGQAFIPVKGWAAAEVESPFARAQEICERLGDSQESYPALFGLWSVSLVRGLAGQARELGFELLRRAQIADDPSLLAMAHYAVGLTLLYTGEFSLAREHQEAMLSLYDEIRDQSFSLVLGADPKGGCLSHVGWTLWCLGYPDQAVEKCTASVEAARTHLNPNCAGGARFFLNVVRMLRREARAVQEGAEWVIAFSTEHGLGGWSLFSQAHKGWALALQGSHEEGLAQELQSVQIQRAIGFNIGLPQMLCQLVDAYMAAGRFDDALGTLADALTAVEAQGERYYEAEIHRLSGELLLKIEPQDVVQARSCFKKAIKVARKQLGRSLELRATTSLARLLASQGHRDEARTMLAEIYGWFTEGFDTADLKDAKTLLDELSVA